MTTRPMLEALGSKPRELGPVRVVKYWQQDVHQRLGLCRHLQLQAPLARTRTRRQHAQHARMQSSCCCVPAWPSFCNFTGVRFILKEAEVVP